MAAPPLEQRPVVILVEEEADERTALREHLDTADFQVLETDETDAALSLLETRSDIGAIVTDAHVPGRIDGFELARMVRERWPQIGVVMTSGHSDSKGGPVPEGSEFVAKPYLLEHLVPALRKLTAPSG